MYIKGMTTIQKFQLPITSTRCHSRRQGFTLIELLVVVAILGILLSIVVTTVSASLRTARNTGCMSNLRQIGTAFSIFAVENKGYLPPNLHPNQSPYFNRDRRYLAHPAKLGPYIGAPVPPNSMWTVQRADMAYADTMVCPARTALGPDHRNMYRINTRVETVSGPIGSPWGNGSATADMLNAANLFVRSKLLSQIKNPSGTWLMADLDAEFPVGSAPNNTPATPVHGKHRNAIYFDMHVARLRIND